MNIIVFNDKLGNTIRIGEYDDNGKWIKWRKKKEFKQLEALANKFKVVVED